MKRFGLVGYPLTHSFSEAYFNNKFRSLGIEASYRAFPLESLSLFHDLLDSEGPFTGLNVTMPYKEKIVDHLDDIDSSAKETGAVNLVKFVTRGFETRLIGYNTDLFGFSESLRFYSITPVKRALILGTGGASRAVSYALRNGGADITLVSRTQARGDMCYSDLNSSDIGQFDLIVNTTPAGTFPHIEEFPDIPYDGLNPATTLYDLVYNPAETVFLKRGIEKGCKTINGLKMLYLQAEKGWEIWNSVNP